MLNIYVYMNGWVKVKRCENHELLSHVAADSAKTQQTKKCEIVEEWGK